jgi:hypothetical protein
MQARTAFTMSESPVFMSEGNRVPKFKRDKNDKERDSESTRSALVVAVHNLRLFPHTFIK